MVIVQENSIRNQQVLTLRNPKKGKKEIYNKYQRKK